MVKSVDTPNQNHLTRGSRIEWTKELHDRFVEAMNDLGGPRKVTPEILRRAMAVEGLTRVQVKSRLQKYRSGKVATNWNNRYQKSSSSRVNVKMTCRQKNSPLQGELCQQLQTAEVRETNLWVELSDFDDIETKSLSPTQQEAYFRIYKSFEKCLRPASNGRNLPINQVVNPPDTFMKHMPWTPSEAALLDRIISNIDASDSRLDFNKPFKYPGLPSHRR